MELNIIHNESCLDGLRKLPDCSVDCCITSPPYFNLRDYGTAEWVGGDPDCDHICLPDSDIDRKYQSRMTSSHILRRSRVVCPKCGAVRKDQQFGIEDSPEEYIANLVEVFSEVRRVLKDTGTLWLNIGDSYNGYKGRGNGDNYDTDYIGHTGHPARPSGYGLEAKNLKQKDLIGIPWMLAFALRESGWYLRQDIIWHKPNPMPESVIDRCTKSHEYIFLLSKSRQYFFDADAIKEEAKWKDDPRAGKGHIDYNGLRDGNPANGQRAFVTITDKRNKRDVWTVALRPNKEAHFATFPEELIMPCVLAGCPRGGGSLRPFHGKWNHRDRREKIRAGLYRLRAEPGIHQDCPEAHHQRIRIICIDL